MLFLIGGLPFMTRQQALPVGILLVLVVIALLAWTLQSMLSAIDQQEFSLMLAGCLVCSGAVGLATVMVMTLNGLLL